MLEKVNNDEMDPEQLVWQEGDPDWMPFFHHPRVQQMIAEQEEIDEEAKRRELERLEREKRRKERELELQLKFKKLRQKEALKNKPKKIVKVKEPGPEDLPPPLPPIPEEEPTPPQQEIVLELPSEPEPVIEPEVELEREVEPEPEIELEPKIELEPELEPEPEIELEPEIESEAEEVESLEEEEFYLEDDEEEDEGEYEEEFFEKEDQRFELKGTKLYLSLGLVTLGVAFILYFSNESFQSTRTPYQVTKATRESLMRVATRPFNGRVSHRLRATKDYNRLWLATNFPYDGVVFIKLQSVPGQVLTSEVKKKVFNNERIVLQSQALLKGKMAYFDEIEILKGDNLLPGFYEYEITSRREGFMAKLSDFLKDKLVFKDMSFTQQKNQHFKVTGSILLSSLDKESFKKRLEVQKKFLERELVRPLKEYRERYQTFIGLLDRIENLYIEIMRRITKGRSIFMFEERYNKEVGPMLTDLIGDSYRRHLSLLNHSPEQSQAYEDLNNYGKDIGLIASEMVTRTKKVGRLRRQNTKAHVDYFKRKVEALKEVGRSRINAIRAKLKEVEP